MMYFLTGNNNKLREVCQILGDDIEQLVLDIELPEIQSLDPVEVLTHKIQTAVDYMHAQDKYDSTVQFFVEDVSLVCDALNGFPGPLIKRCLASMGSEGLYRILSDYDDYGASVICTIGYRDGMQIHIHTGELHGQIVTPRGDDLFGFDPVFKPDGFDQTFGEMDAVIKNSISHRRLALDALHSQRQDKSL